LGAKAGVLSTVLPKFNWTIMKQRNLEEGRWTETIMGWENKSDEKGIQERGWKSF
jgi:hypothetical protein